MKRHGRPAAVGQVRIIGGRWRGSKLPVADVPGLRPSADRVRETLFNWLMPVLRGAQCLDLFAGSGALGFEAASRGAGYVRLLERDPRLCASLQDSGRRLQAETVDVRCGDALALLAGAPERCYDVVFVDPPFDAALWPAVFERLPPHLANEAWMYVESPVAAPAEVPADWLLHRAGRTRDAHYELYRRRAAGHG